MAPLKVYTFWGSSPCRAVCMICQKLGLDVEYCHLELFQGEHMTEEYKKVNPDQVVPTVVDNGFTLWESRAVARYLVEKFAAGNDLYPFDLKKRALIDRMLDLDLSDVYKEILAYAYPIVAAGEDSDPTKMEAMLKRLNDKVFNSGQFATGDCITIADIFFIASLTFLDMANYTIKPEEYPNVVTWMNKMKAADFYGPIDVHFKAKKAEFAQAGKSVIV